MEATEKQKIIDLINDAERNLIAVRNRLERIGKPYSESDGYSHYRSKILTLIDVCDALGIDRTEYNWVINA